MVSPFVCLIAFCLASSKLPLRVRPMAVRFFVPASYLIFSPSVINFTASLLSAAVNEVASLLSVLQSSLAPLDLPFKLATNLVLASDDVPTVNLLTQQVVTSVASHTVLAHVAPAIRAPVYPATSPHTAPSVGLLDVVSVLHLALVSTRIRLYVTTCPTCPFS